jgi:hypothetical protein
MGMGKPHGEGRLLTSYASIISDILWRSSELINELIKRANGRATPSDVNLDHDSGFAGDMRIHLESVVIAESLLLLFIDKGWTGRIAEPAMERHLH